MPLPPGTRLGFYEIVAPLGAGGMGEVYRARDTRLGREVAIKALPAEFARDAGRLARFEREAKLLASLNHPNIAAIYGLEETEGVPRLVLELVPGETLADRLARGPLPVREALEVCTQIASAVEAAHEGGVVHRDLKPGNVMLTPAGAVKVLDFGLATGGPAAAARPADLSQSPTMSVAGGGTGVILGTAAYMSPEQARGQAVDRRTDLWSFGCVFYECLAGRRAFAGDTVSDLIARILEREPEWSALPAGTPPGVRDVLRRCLRKDASERPRDIREVRLGLTAAGASAAGKRGAGEEQSIAVLPFASMSGSDDEFFSDGMTEEIINALAQLPGLRVAARTSSFAFKGKLEDLRLVGEKLNVSTVLEGSVRKAGARLRITAQLINVADGYHLWSERYDRELTDVFEVQDEIANAIAAKLKLTLAGGEDRSLARRGTLDMAAYELFLKGRALQNQRGRAVLEAIACFERAVELDPGYADALAWLADSYRLMGTYGMRPPDEVMPRARAAAERALALDPELSEAYATLADVAAQYDRDAGLAWRSWERALELDPRNIRARAERALWGLGLGMRSLEEAIGEARQAAEDDPLSAWAVGMHSLVLGLAGRHDEGVAEAQRAAALDPHSFIGLWGVVRSHAWAGQYAPAIATAPTALAISGRHPFVMAPLAMAHAGLGNTEIAEAIREEMLARARMEYVPKFWLATIVAAAGYLDEAMQLAERAIDERDPMVLLAAHMPEWAPLRGHPGFGALLQKLGTAGKP